ncbi:hypothetical protein QOZ80_7BG0591170 [Eleusine coracana subsp. coracana]|nr:hypothetical protein QOZ80_7BG0591170 [Eleusine coracana subsp. coracana]
MMDPRRRSFVVVAAVAVMMMVVGVGGDFAADRAECSDKLVGLATCLTYVQEHATAVAPTPDCCAGLKTVLQTSRKCLCVLVKDKDDPNLGLKINVSKALGLPAVCKASANISDCPRLLNLAPNSKEAQVFEDYAKQAGAQVGPPSAPGGGVGANEPKKSGAAASVGPIMLRWLGVGGARAAVLSIFSALVVPFILLLG